MMTEPNETDTFEDPIAQGIAAVIAADEQLAQPEALVDLFLEELNRLWADPEPLTLN
jgi:hypothetical protein